MTDQFFQSQPSIITVHGPPGLMAGELLRKHDIELREGDILLIAEHDDEENAWIDQHETAMSLARVDRSRFA